MSREAEVYMLEIPYDCKDFLCQFELVNFMAEKLREETVKLKNRLPKGASIKFYYISSNKCKAIYQVRII